MLSLKETKQLVSLLKKIDNPHEGLPQPVFDALLKLIPFVACELVITDRKGVLLTYRHDKWFKGWHFPGGLLRYRESFEERLEHVAWEELGINLTSQKLMFIIDHSQGARGHGISLVFHCETVMTPKTGKFFKKMPKNIIEAHKELWNKVNKIKN